MMQIEDGFWMDEVDYYDNFDNGPEFGQRRRSIIYITLITMYAYELHINR